MRYGVKLELSTELGPAEVDFNSQVTGFATTAQNSLVDLATEEGTDQVFQDRGTPLFGMTSVGDLLDEGERGHQTALAAELVRLFSRFWEQDRAEETEREVDPVLSLSKVTVQVSEIGLQRINFNVYFENAVGDQIGRDIQELL